MNRGEPTMRYGCVWWRAVMLNGRLLAACDEQASKNSPTRRSGLIVKSGKEVYRIEEYLSVAYLRKSMVALLSANHSDDPHENDLVQL
jgi:hypothetical protein